MFLSLHLLRCLHAFSKTQINLPRVDVEKVYTVESARTAGTLRRLGVKPVLGNRRDFSFFSSNF